MGKKKDCFGVEDFVCMTANCPYARECIQAVWKKRLNRAMARRDAPRDAPRRIRGRVTVES